MIKIVTHSGGFHADDVFAVAAFQLLLGKENVEVIRTRDEAVIEAGDYVVDVGGAYDHEAKRYDHHQPGAPVRENGIPYAGFGLVWRHYGEEICGSKEIADAVEERLCQPIDAGDNGIELYQLNELNVQPYELFNVVASYRPVEDEPEKIHQAFIEATDFARALLIRLFTQLKEKLRLEALVQTTYVAASDKSLLLFEEPVSGAMLRDFPDTKLLVCPYVNDGREVWRVSAVQDEGFANRVSFPEAWAGLSGEKLVEVSGIADAIFCHKNQYMCIVESKESAIAAAKQAS